MCVCICRLTPSSPRKTSLNRSASSWTPARELGLALPPGGKKHHLQLHCRLARIYTLQFVAHTHVGDYSFCMARLLGKLPASNWRVFISHTIVVHCKYQPNKLTVFISWYLTCMLMLKLAFSAIKHGKMVIYYSLVPFWCFWTQSVYLSAEINKTERHGELAAGEHFYILTSCIISC